MSRATAAVILLLAGCSRGPLSASESGVPEPATDLDAMPLSVMDGDPSDVSPWPGDSGADLEFDGTFQGIDYNRSATTTGANPGYLDAKLSKLSLILTDWGYGKAAKHCEKTLKPYQLGDILAAADHVAWTTIYQTDVNCPAETHWQLTVLLTPKQGEPMLVQTSWCDQASDFPPADLQSFLKVVTEVEATVCGF